MATTYTLTNPGVTTITDAGWPNGALIYNQSATGTVYACDRPGGETDGFPITPLGSLTWGQGRPLYLTTDTTGTVAVVDQDSSSSLSLPAAIASQLRTQGLAQQIANDINTSGVTVVDVPVEIVNVQGITPPAGGEQLPTTTPIDVSKYASMMFFLYSARKDGTTPDSTDVVQWSLNYYFPQSDSIPLWTSADTVGGDYASVISGVSPVKGDLFNVTCGFTTADPTQYEVNCVVVGSLKTVPEFTYACNNVRWENLAGATPYAAWAKNTQLSATIPANTFTNYAPSHCNGKMSMSWYVSSGPNATGSNVGIETANKAGVYIAGTHDQSTVDTQVLNAFPTIPVGNRQPILQVRNFNANAVTYQVCLGWD